MSKVLLQLNNWYAGYGDVDVLNNLHFRVNEGEIVALVGSNGAGKTTLLRSLSRTLKGRGDITFAGRSLYDETPEKVFESGLVQVPEGRLLFDQMSVHENLLMGAYRRQGKAAIEASLERVYGLFPKLYERRQQRSGSMSGGEQQMCAMGRALMANPKLLLVDEMSLGLAPVIVDQLLEILSTIRNEGITVLLVEQDIYAALEIADRGYVMVTGTITQSGSADELKNDPHIREAYLGL
ncbi:ABC transporter ATP-binding protein [Ferrovum sp. PN-J185]|uniref:ABC transporter ATP-binding protein n=1 Tax=Ferrovum sp. PN-J185 TaxID=1356306 RepID=UPI000791C622|nr:ABC transporter ATP-binding protein [Ferrovum sp. PN-J185]KXW56554.1 high-affinity branched-chain amino acid transport ATP-binding protein LivF [Ferrovum sp. PN-J185]MCC6068098.1 ABC transporter ATP-binding protein [Ferrovum sp. PN-J185]MDE1891791.1 ABC transporter ATP-binding protein [Betaproteobacteria bacterium]MDE2056363.1 ABC transporter ATP-binding protein [Betaproteobacteria bacterium]